MLYIDVRINGNKTNKIMTLSEIKQDAKNYKGTEITMATFRYCFNQGTKVMNQLIKDDVFEVSGTNRDGQKIYRVK